MRDRHSDFAGSDLGEGAWLYGFDVALCVD